MAGIIFPDWGIVHRMAHDLFISHSSLDKAVADAACAILEAQGLRCWIAPRDILPGIDWTQSVIDAIHSARCMVLIFSRHSNSSELVLREVERAVHRGIPVVPVRIEEVSLSGGLELLISIPHWMDALTPPVEAHMRRLAASLKMLLAKTSEPAAAMSGPAVSAPVTIAPKPAIAGKMPKTSPLAVSMLSVALIVGSLAALYVAHQWKQRGDTPAGAQAVNAPPEPSPVLPAQMASSPGATAVAEKARSTAEAIPSAGVVARPTADSSDGNALLASGDYAGAIARFEITIKADPNNVQALAGHGIASIKLDVNPDSRREELKKAISLKPDLALAYAWLSFDTDDPAQALEYSKSAASIDSNLCEAHAALAFSYGAAGDPIHGMSETMKANQMDSRNTLAMMALARSGDARGIEFCKSAIEIDPNFVYCYLIEAMISKGDVLIFGNNTSSLKRISPASATSFALRSIYDGAIGKREESYKDAMEALKIRPGSATMLHFAATTESFTGRIDDAKKHIDAAYRICPSSPEITQLRERIEQ